MSAYGLLHPSVERFLAEHRRLHVMLRLARSAILHSGGPERDGTPADVVGIIRQIRDSFAQHFAEEESAHWLDDAVTSRPELASQARRIHGEHSELLGEIDKLIAQAMDGVQSLQNKVAIEKAFDDLCERIYAHETAENDLLRAGVIAGLPAEAQAQTLSREPS
jgi:hypothetical protein